MMLRPGCNGYLARPAFRFIASCNRSSSHFAPVNALKFSASRPRKLPRSTSLALTIHIPFGQSLQRYASTINPHDRIDAKSEKAAAEAVLESHPEEVSVNSSVHLAFEEKATEEPEKDVEMLAGVWSDIVRSTQQTRYARASLTWAVVLQKIVKDTFALHEVPREAFVIGMAGVLPYLATSLSTVYLAWDINHAAITGHGFLVSGQTAELLLHIVEPLQIGYGAVIISFLGAIHWGLEWAKYGGEHGYSRYAYGVIAPAVAWPTLLFPIEYALISQFLAFTFLYYADALAVTRGWAPHWYSTYRFVLTFIVGASIVASLIGRGQIADKIGKLPGPADRMKAIRDSQMESLDFEERERRARIVAQDEEEGEEDDDE